MAEISSKSQSHDAYSQSVPRAPHDNITPTLVHDAWNGTARRPRAMARIAAKSLSRRRRESRLYA
ncbi:hypothetical protein TIFTF001_020385 [Ficus carica]|uniref:Uncharacterized protein n=1 Tax=Ficus carica TaxID=3494 RepID=A0AA88AFP0_FICCA|nr:hypothetical protein TIFTF001_020385 [Ficus carica]